jgi:hypothetical protein
MPPPRAEPPEEVVLPRPRLALAWLVVVLIAALVPIARSILSRLAR